jgi:hypothetical protein
LRPVFGKITFEDGTVPTRSRAMARTSFFWSNFLAFAMETNRERWRLSVWDTTPYLDGVLPASLQ